MDDFKQQPSDYRDSHLKKGADYDRAILESGNFDTYMAEREEILLHSVIPSLFPAGPFRYLDFACGTGRITSIVEKYAETSIGLDISDTMLSEARKKCESTSFIVGDITTEELDIEPVDCVTSFRFFGNAQDELRSAALEKLRELIKPNGSLVVNNHRNPFSLHELLGRLKGDSPDTDLSYWKLKSLLHQHGFSINKTLGVGLWICSSRLRKSPYVSSLRHLEGLSTLPGVGPFCPDMIVTATRL